MVFGRLGFVLAAAFESFKIRTNVRLFIFTQRTGQFHGNIWRRTWDLLWSFSCRWASVSVSNGTILFLQLIANERRRRSTKSSHRTMGEFRTHWVWRTPNRHIWVYRLKFIISCLVPRNPTPASNELPRWQQASKFPLNYYRIGNLNEHQPFIAMETGLYDDRARFWREIGAHSPPKVAAKDELCV